MLKLIDKVGGFAIQKRTREGEVLGYQMLPIGDDGKIIHDAARCLRFATLRQCRKVAKAIPKAVALL